MPPPANESQPRFDFFGDKAAVDSVGRHANSDWIAAAEFYGRLVARSHPTLTSLDVIDRIPAYFSTSEPRALGAVMRSLARAGVIKRTDSFVQSNLRRNHNRPVRVWRSLVLKFHNAVE